MTRQRCAYLVAWVLVASAVQGSPAPVAVASHGTTLVSAQADGLSIQVHIKTHEVQIGKPSDGRPDVIESSCTYSRYPCSVVDRINIVVNGSSLWIPRSAFCDLGDLMRAEISAHKGVATLRLSGGQASEVYSVAIEFDEKRVLRRTVWSGLEPHTPTQETVYHAVSVGDE